MHASGLIGLWLVCSGAAEPDAPMLLDFGGRHGPVLEGFSGVSPSHADDARVVWASTPSGTITGPIPEALLDGVVGASVALALPPGTWHGRALMGWAEPSEKAFGSVAAWGMRQDGVELWRDAPADDVDVHLASRHYAANPRPDFTEGTAWDRQIAPHARWMPFTVEVSHGPVTLSAFGRPLQALILAKEASVADAKVRDADLARAADFAAHHPAAKVENPDWGDAVGLAQAGWAELPSGPADHDLTWEISAARGERFGTTWWLHGSDDPVTVTVEGLGGLEVELFEVTWLDAIGQPLSHLRPRPTWMVPTDGHLEGGQGMPVGVGVVVTAPSSGRRRHAGTLVLQQGQITHRVPIRVLLDRWQLVPAPVPTGLSVQPNELLTQRLGWGHPRVLAQLDEVLELLMQRGMTAIALRRAQWPHAYGAPGEDFDATVLTHVMDRWETLGGEVFLWNDLKFPMRPIAYYRDGPVLPGPWRPVLSQMFDALTGREMSVGVPIYEEEGWKDLGVLHRARRFAERLRELTPEDVDLVANFGHPASWRLADLYDVAKVSAMPSPSRARSAWLRERGADVSVYNLAAGRSGPVTAWAVDAKSLIQWNFSPSRADPFHKLKAKADWFYGVLAPDGQTWAAVTLERYAQGVTDTRYLATVAAWSDRVGEDAPADARAARDAARSFLEGVRSAAEDAIVLRQYDGETLPPAVLEDIRQQARAHLRALSRWVDLTSRGSSGSHDGEG